MRVHLTTAGATTTTKELNMVKAALRKSLPKGMHHLLTGGKTSKYAGLGILYEKDKMRDPIPTVFLVSVKRKGKDWLLAARASISTPLFSFDTGGLASQNKDLNVAIETLCQEFNKAIARERVEADKQLKSPPKSYVSPYLIKQSEAVRRMIGK